MENSVSLSFRLQKEAWGYVSLDAYCKVFLEINRSFNVRTNNVQMFLDNHDDGLDIIGLENTGMDLVSLKPHKPIFHFFK